MRMVGAVLADRAEHSLGEGAMPAAADYGRSASAAASSSTSAGWP
jgi:hypothetical protein